MLLQFLIIMFIWNPSGIYARYFLRHALDGLVAETRVGDVCSGHS